MRSVLVLSMALFLFGCGTYQLNPEAEHIRVGKNDPPNTCKELGVVEGRGATAYWSDNATEISRKRMKNAAGELGANYLRLDTIGSGTAFKCPVDAKIGE